MAGHLCVCGNQIPAGKILRVKVPDSFDGAQR
jgi:hypothetical protein